MAIPSWLHITPTTGDHNGSFTVQADAHTGRLARSATITGTTGHGTTKSLSVSQAAAAEVIRIEGVYLDGNKIDPTGTDSPHYAVSLEAKNSSVVWIYFISNSKDLTITDAVGTVPLDICTTKLYICPGSTSPASGGSLVEPWSYNTSPAVPNDPGKDEVVRYCIALTEFQENQSTDEVPYHELRIANSTTGGPDTVYSNAYIDITQKAGTKTYSNPVVKTFTYNEVPAAGTNAMTHTTPTIACEQTWGWNGNVVNGGTITTGFEYTYAAEGIYVNTSSGALEEEVPSLGTTIKERTKLGTMTVTVEANGKSATGSADVYQEANTVTYGAPIFTVKEDSPINFTSAAQKKLLFGGMLNAIVQGTTYTSGATQTINFDPVRDIASGDITLTEKAPLEGFSIDGSGVFLGVSVTDNYSDTARNGYQVTITAKKNGKTSTKDYVFNQAAGGSMIVFNPASITFTAEESRQIVTVTSNDTWTIS